MTLQPPNPLSINCHPPPAEEEGRHFEHPWQKNGNSLRNYYNIDAMNAAATGSSGGKPLASLPSHDDPTALTATSARIITNKRSVSIPQACVCCLGPANSQFTAAASISQGSTTHSMSLKFPICARCQEHFSASQSRSLLIDFLVPVPVCLFSAALLGLILKRQGWLADSPWVFLWLAVPAALGLAARLLLGRFNKHQELPPTCVCRERAVALDWVDGNNYVIELQNSQYALALAKANDFKPEFHQLSPKRHGRGFTPRPRAPWSKEIESLSP